MFNAVEEVNGIRGANSSLIEKYGAYLTENMIKDIQKLEVENTRLKEEIGNREIPKAALKVLLKYATSSVAIMDSNYNYIWVNMPFAQKDSRSVADYPGHNHFEFYPSDVKEVFEQVVRTKEVYKAYNWPFTDANHPELGVTYFDWTLVPVLNLSDEVELLVYFRNDVTEHVRVQEKLVESQERYHTIFNNSLDAILLAIPGSTILSANPAACHMFGRTEEELCTVEWNELFDIDDPRVLQAFKKRGELRSFTSEMTLLRKDGTKFDGEVTSNLFKDKNGQILSSMIVRDMSERKKTEEALRLSEDKFYKAFHHNQTMMAFIRLKDDVFIDVNNSYAKVLGYSREEMIGKNVFELSIWADLEEKQNLRKQLAENGCVRNTELKFRSKSGDIIYVVATSNLLDIAGEECILASLIDITELKKTVDDLRKSKELFNKTCNANPLIMAIFSAEDFKIMEVNYVFVQKFGYTREESIGLTAVDINIWLDINDRKRYLEELDKNGFIENYETRFRNKSGDILNVLLTGFYTTWNDEQCIFTIVNDITELRHYQHEMARLDGLNLVGEMAAGIGHEIRNPMTTVRGFLQLLGEKERYATDKEYMNLMIEELDRANSIITEFLTLAKDKTVELKRQSLNQTVRTILPLLQADAMKQNKSIEVHLGEIPNVVIDRNEIKQLIINLVRNGLEAMPPGGILSIKTFKDNDGVVLAVQDQGKGIKPEVLEKIGTPFFTTKDTGTGLGLAVCYSIAQRHNARIDFKTSTDGTTFYVRFNL
ncbi:Sporulation kinase E [Sporotomaculum syntrophicum]|uniref:histidine kinase n=1 Tax=Sporotomaculum syntrophicum TaxID=182264 RepID=A0A9D3AXI0_9FIRM|nr:Sporulation kinase E [Sporotomaculum syntrophicum]